MSTAKQLEPYFPRHLERDIYVTLLNTSDPPTPDSLLKAALMRRAVIDITRILRVREDKPALQNLLQKGSIGDDLWNSLLAAEKELEAEIIEVVAEANSFVPGWGQIIFQTAGEMIANEKTKSVWDRLPEMRMENGASMFHPFISLLSATRTVVDLERPLLIMHASTLTSWSTNRRTKVWPEQETHTSPNGTRPVTTSRSQATHCRRTSTPTRILPRHPHHTLKYQTS